MGCVGATAGQVNGGNGEKQPSGGLRFVRRILGLHAPLMKKYPFEVVMFHSSGLGIAASQALSPYSIRES
jgi:hypothetical protein